MHGEHALRLLVRGTLADLPAKGDPVSLGGCQTRLDAIADQIPLEFGEAGMMVRISLPPAC